jgi:hypothetical protein
LALSGCDFLGTPSGILPAHDGFFISFAQCVVTAAISMLLGEG